MEIYLKKIIYLLFLEKMSFYIKALGSNPLELSIRDYNNLDKIKLYICDKFQTEDYNIMLICNGITIDSDEKVKNIKENDTLHLNLLSPLVYSINGSPEKKIIYDLEKASIFKIPEVLEYEDNNIIIYQWGGYQYGIDEGTFRYLRNYFETIHIKATDTPDLTYVTNMSQCFRNVKVIGDISKWDVSNVTDMSYMFYSSICDSDISNWKINKDCVMDYIFYNSNINLDLSKWGITEMKKLRKMFSSIREGDCQNCNDF